MKLRFCLILSFILQFTSFSQVIWQPKGPTPQTDLKSVYFINTNTGLVCGTGGYVYKTTNAGFSWDSKTTPTTKKLNSIWFYSTSNGIAVGDSGTVIYTNDAGENWSLQSPVTSFDLRKIFFYDNLNVFIVCSSGRILKSTNSGSNWSLINLNVADLFEIDKTNNTMFIGSLDSKYIKSTDIGASWQLVTTEINQPAIFHVHFISLDTGYMYGSFYSRYKTTNGGINWAPHAAPYAVSNTAYLNSKFGIGIYHLGQIYKTTNGGDLWGGFGPANIQGDKSYSVFVLDSNNFYAVSSGGIILHHSSGNSTLWNIIGGSDNSCTDMSFSNNNNGIIAGYEEQLWTTTTGGNKWNIQSLCNNTYFESSRTYAYSVYYKDSMTVYFTRKDIYNMFGNSGSILVSTNGGISWGSTLTQPNTTFNKIGGAGNSILCCTGKIIRNNGSGWFDYLTVPQMNLFDFSFINENTGIVLGHNTSSTNIRKIYSTTNNGINWIEQQTPMIAVNVYLRNSGIGLICGDSGKVLRTTNYGTNWTLYSAPTQRYLRSVFMLNDITAWAVGEQGAMIYTINSGMNWNLVPAYTTKSLYKILFTDQSTGYVAGGSGTVLKTTDGGLTFINSGTNEIPSSFGLLQNYPNPFNPATTIDFLVPAKNNVKIEIYDVSGKLIEVLTDKEYSPGNYSVDWNAINYSSGIYFYKMTSGGFTESKKMILLK